MLTKMLKVNGKTEKIGEMREVGGRENRKKSKLKRLKMKSSKKLN